MKQIKRAGQSVRSGLSLMCIVCLLCGLLCGFFWLAGESPVLAAGVDGDALSARAVLSGDASLSAPERDEKLAVQPPRRRRRCCAHACRRHGRCGLYRDGHLRLHTRVHR